MPGPGLWPAAFISLGLWAIVNERVLSGRARFLLNYLWGAVYFGIIIFWLARVTLLDFVPVVVLAPFFIAFAGFVYRRLRRAMPAAAALPLAWLASDVVRSIPPFSFPWDLLGYAAAGWLDVAGMASVGGVWILTMLIAFANGAAVDAYVQKTAVRRLAPAALAISIVIICAFAGARLRAVPASLPLGPRFACIQPNLEQELKEDPTALDTYYRKIVEGMDAAGRENADIIVLPETMLPSPLVRGLAPSTAFGPDVRAEHYIQLEKKDLLTIRKIIGPKPWLLAGAIVHDTEPVDGEFPLAKNSAVLFDTKNTEVGRYDKMYLVPGGELVPLLPEGVVTRWIRRLLDPFTNGMVPNLIPGERRPNLEFKNAATGEIVNFGVSICYDNVFPAPFRLPAKAGAQFHVVLSNEGWFTRSNEMEAMLGFSAIRAIETRRAVLRATNTGISCLIGPDGSLREIFERGGRRSEIGGTFVTRPPVADGQTLYVTVGDLPFYLIAAASTILALVLRVRAGTSKAAG